MPPTHVVVCCNSGLSSDVRPVLLSLLESPVEVSKSPLALELDRLIFPHPQACWRFADGSFHFSHGKPQSLIACLLQTLRVAVIVSSFHPDDKHFCTINA
jgi:hypothetical protein